MSKTSVPAGVEALRAAQADEYGQYKAARAIDLGGARAFNVGDPVPASHVERGVVPADAVTSTNKTSEKG